MEKDVFKHVLPEQLIAHFDVESVTELPIPGTKRFQLHVHLVEKNVLPAGYDPSEWESKGFVEPKKVQDFPLRGKMVFLLLQCRRWRHKSDPNRVIRNDFAFLADGAKLTADLAAFLKGAGR